MSSTACTLITGCASGIGRALAADLLREGRCVIATDLDEAGLERAASEGAWPGERVLLRRLDVRDAAAWEAILDAGEGRFGPVETLCNVAGYLKPGFAHDLEAEEVERHIDVNVKGTLHGTMAAAKRMKARGRGHIVNIASIAGVVPVPGLSLYSASKFAVRGFSIAAAQELRAHGVFVTVLCPDAVKTPMLEKQVAAPEASLTFSGKVLTVDDVVAAVRTCMKKRPVQMLLPPMRGRLAAVANLAPQMAPLLEPLFRRRGRKMQQRMQGGDG